MGCSSCWDEPSRYCSGDPTQSLSSTWATLHPPGMSGPGASGLQVEAVRPAQPGLGFLRVMVPRKPGNPGLQTPQPSPGAAEGVAEAIAAAVIPLSTEMGAPLAYLFPALCSSALMYWCILCPDGWGAGAGLFAALAAKGPSSPGKYNYCFGLIVYFLHSLILKAIMIFSSPLGAGEAAEAISCREGLWELFLPGSTRVPAARRRRPLLLPLVICNQKGKKKWYLQK